ncbi:MAG TPA: helix-turn-helix domain-containing protein [Actinomycetes bacterium]|nr:helix-turn-helix domain-containing protein [Actinomycetes bacterium]
MVTDVHDGQTNGPFLTDAGELLLLVRRLDPDAFARIFRKQLPDADLMSIIAALPRERLSRLMTYARGGPHEPRTRPEDHPPARPMARAIRIARKRAGMNQWELAVALGIRQSSVSQWERDQTEPGGQRVVELMRVLPGLADILKAQVSRSGAGEADGQAKASGPG